MPGSGLGPKNATVNWAELTNSGRETDTRKAGVQVKNVVIEKEQDL